LLMFKKIAAHYENLANNLTLSGPACSIQPAENTVLVLVHGVNAGTMSSLAYARSISANYAAVHVEIHPEVTETFQKECQEYFPEVPLIMLPSPYRSLVNPILTYLDEVHEQHPDKRITVIIGEFASDKWWHSLLHGNTGLLLKLALLGRPDVVVTN